MNPERRRFWKRILIACALIVAGVVALAVGLGVGLNQGGSAEDEDSDSPPLSNDVAFGEYNETQWRPEAETTWQIVLQDAIDFSGGSLEPDVEVFDIDLFTNSQDTIQGLQDAGHKVICYFSAGSYEPYRPDSDLFQDGDLGSTMDGWPDERWLDIRTSNVRRIMAARIKLAAEKGCNGIDPDNVDGYVSRLLTPKKQAIAVEVDTLQSNSNGVGLSEQDTIDFMRYLSRYAVSYGLALGLKNAGSIVNTVSEFTEFSVNEQCVQYSECSTFARFIELGKPVFHIEYPEDVSSSDWRGSNQYCSNQGDAEGSEGFSTVLKNMDLDGFVRYCNGDVATTDVMS